MFRGLDAGWCKMEPRYEGINGRRELGKGKVHRPDSVTPEDMFPLLDCRLEVERR